MVILHCCSTSSHGHPSLFFYFVTRLHFADSPQCHTVVLRCFSAVTHGRTSLCSCLSVAVTCLTQVAQLGKLSKEVSQVTSARSRRRHEDDVTALLDQSREEDRELSALKSVRHRYRWLDSWLLRLWWLASNAAVTFILDTFAACYFLLHCELISLAPPLFSNG